MPAYYAILLLLVIAWGAFAFGAVYDWAYQPLTWACAGIGLLGLVWPQAIAGRPLEGASGGTGSAGWWRVGSGAGILPLAGALALLVAAVGIQLVPLSPDAIASVSPAADALLRKHDLAYALSTSIRDVPYRHPLSIDARRR